MKNVFLSTVMQSVDSLSHHQVHVAIWIYNEQKLGVSAVLS